MSYKTDRIIAVSSGCCGGHKTDTVQCCDDGEQRVEHSAVRARDDEHDS